MRNGDLPRVEPKALSGCVVILPQNGYAIGVMRIPLFAMILAFLAGEGLAQEAIAPPAVGLSEGKAMIVLARSAMTEYLLHRTPADSQILPMEMQALKDHK